MKLDENQLILLIFVIIISIIVITGNSTNVLLMISIIANVLLVLKCCDNRNPTEHIDNMEKNTANTVNTISAINTVSDPQLYEPINPNDIYGEYHTQYNAYKPILPLPRQNVGVSCGELTYTVDGSNAHMAAKRARDRRCMDGLISKDKYYYAHHYADELDLEERKPWWGQSDY